MANQFQRENVQKIKEFEHLQENFENMKSQNTKKVSTYDIDKKNELQSKYIYIISINGDSKICKNLAKSLIFNFFFNILS